MEENGNGGGNGDLVEDNGNGGDGGGVEMVDDDGGSVNAVKVASMVMNDDCEEDGFQLICISVQFD